MLPPDACAFPSTGGHSRSPPGDDVFQQGRAGRAAVVAAGRRAAAAVYCAFRWQRGASRYIARSRPRTLSFSGACLAAESRVGAHAASIDCTRRSGSTIPVGASNINATIEDMLGGGRGGAVRARDRHEARSLFDDKMMRFSRPPLIRPRSGIARADYSVASSLSGVPPLALSALYSDIFAWLTFFPCPQTAVCGAILPIPLAMRPGVATGRRRRRSSAAAIHRPSTRMARHASARRERRQRPTMRRMLPPVSSSWTPDGRCMPGPMVPFRRYQCQSRWEWLVGDGAAYISSARQTAWLSSPLIVAPFRRCVAPFHAHGRKAQSGREVTRAAGEYCRCHHASSPS